jgi:DNA mismatch endonuclease (patch repair protein)
LTPYFLTAMSRAGAAPRFDTLGPASEWASKAKQQCASKGTKPELLLRRQLWVMGYRYRLHARDLPGKSDLVFRRQRVAVFVDGDFWHGRDWERRKQRLASGHNAAYWQSKIAYNIERDAKHTADLQTIGWQVLRLWETDIRKSPDDAARRVIALIRR